MNNKKQLSLYIIISLIIISIFTIINIYQYHEYTSNYNSKLSQIISTIKTNYPNIKDEEILSILNNEDKTDYMKIYGYDLYQDNYLKINQNKYKEYLITNILFLVISLSVIITIILLNNHRANKEINKIRKLLSDINDKKYHLHLDESGEDVFSQLKSEIYKTTIVLKELAENSIKDKRELKTSLEDISHQLKTPLTSILVMLDNIIDDPDMDEEIRLDFINDIKREVNNISFLVQNILKLSKLDSNTIVFNKSNTKIIDIINNSIKNINSLCDLKNINIITKGKKDSKVFCDARWQVEAITNIIKNCIEHSNSNTNIKINYEETKVYSQIIIQDEGKGISKKDLPHIFERFYKSENSTSDSVGIGLALSKSIIEEDNGSIIVKSNNTGTTFIIKYYK